MLLKCVACAYRTSHRTPPHTFWLKCVACAYRTSYRTSFLITIQKTMFFRYRFCPHRTPSWISRFSPVVPGEAHRTSTGRLKRGENGPRRVGGPSGRLPDVYRRPPPGRPPKILPDTPTGHPPNPPPWATGVFARRHISPSLLPPNGAILISICCLHHMAPCCLTTICMKKKDDAEVEELLQFESPANWMRRP